MPGFAHRLHSKTEARQTPALVGLDPRWDLLPESIKAVAAQQGGSTEDQQARAFESFCCELIDIVAPLVPAVKPQIAFFEQLGPAGMLAARNVIRYARERDLIVIADAKRGDIGSTAEAYAAAWLAGENSAAAPFAADALTVNAYLGTDTLQPFVDAAKQRGAGLYVLVRTSNPGAGSFQDRETNNTKLFEHVADVLQQLNREHWPDDRYGSVGAVVGATWPTELAELRARMPNVPLLIPGYGSQGGTAADVAGGFDQHGLGALVNSSRGINFAYTKAKYSEQFAADQWRDAVQQATLDMIEDLQAANPQIRTDHQN